MEILSSISHGIQGIGHVCESFEKIQLFRDKPHLPVFYTKDKVFGCDRKGNCRGCNAHLQIYIAKMEYDYGVGIRYFDM